MIGRMASQAAATWVYSLVPWPLDAYEPRSKVGGGKIAMSHTRTTSRRVPTMRGMGRAGLISKTSGARRG